MNNTTRILLASTLLPLAASAATVVDFDVSSQATSNSPNLSSGFGLDRDTPTLTSSFSGYSGPDVHGALNPTSTQGGWNVSVNTGSGARVRMNNSVGNSVDGLSLFPTASVRFAPGNDLLNTSTIHTSRKQRVRASVPVAPAPSREFMRINAAFAE